MSLTVYRLSKARHAGDLSGEGARLFGGRWNERGTPALYTSPAVSLALLEVLVHVGELDDLPENYTVTVVEIDEPPKLRLEELPAGREEAQRIGNKLLLDPKQLGFWVPSVVVPTEWNLVLNPRALGYAEVVKVREMYLLEVDVRLRGSR